MEVEVLWVHTRLQGHWYWIKRDHVRYLAPDPSLHSPAYGHESSLTGNVPVHSRVPTPTTDRLGHLCITAFCYRTYECHLMISNTPTYTQTRHRIRTTLSPLTARGAQPRVLYLEITRHTIRCGRVTCSIDVAVGEPIGVTFNGGVYMLTGS